MFSVSTQIEQSNALSLSTFVIPYHLDDNMVLIVLKLTYADLWYHSWFVDFNELH